MYYFSSFDGMTFPVLSNLEVMEQYSNNYHFFLYFILQKSASYMSMLDRRGIGKILQILFYIFIFCNFKNNTPPF